MKKFAVQIWKTWDMVAFLQMDHEFSYVVYIKYNNYSGIELDSFQQIIYN